MVGVLVIDMRKLSYPPIWLLFEQGRVQVAAGAPFAVGAYGCRGLARGRAPADSGRFRRKWAPISPWSWTSVRFSAGVVRCWLCRPGETPMLGGVSGRFALRNRPEVCRWGLLGLKVAHEDVQFRRGRDDAERIGAFAECGDRNTSIG